MSEDTQITSVYIPHPTEKFQEAVVVHYSGNEYTVADRHGRRIKLDAKDVLPASPLGENGVADMVNLQHLNEASILMNLRKRFGLSRIYTYSGSILISVNPYKNLPIYTPAIVRMYSGQAIGALPPHIYAIADTAYRSMMTEKRDQSILISGESGAGKTEAAKKILEFIATVSEKDTIDKSVTPPHQQVLATQPILEAFGNAKTIRNDNSSRFGKLLETQFDAQGYLIGAKVNNYLLEQSRVVKQGPGERNFHSFYYVLAGADKTERDLWQITASKDYEYTKNGQPDLPGINSKYEYMKVKRAMSVAGLSPHEQHMCFALIAAILFLGNIKFKGGDKSEVANVDTLNWACYLLQTSAKAMTQALTIRENFIRGERFVVPLTEQQAEDARDTLAKQLYSRNFEFLVGRLNQLTNRENESQRCISLLDIFGFEVFEKNSFEQMCINYANERLQYQFNEHIFKLELEEYKREEIDTSNFTYVDNQPTIDLFEKKPVGLILLLDEESRFPNGNDESFVKKCHDNQSSHPHFQTDRFKKRVFTVKHYAGAVMYDADRFLEKNKQRFSPLFTKTMRQSDVEYYQNLFANEPDEQKQATGRSKDKATVGLVFRDQLNNLMKVLNATTPHYVRCIKPNGFKSPVQMENDSVIHQLRYSGVLETIRIRQGGYPNRRPTTEFLARYKILVPGWIPRGSKAQQVSELMRQLDVRPEQFQIGLTKVFLKDEAFHNLEGLRNEYFHEIVTKIQKMFRGYKERKKFKQLRMASKYVAYWLQRYLAEQDCVEEILQALDGAQKCRNTKDVCSNVQVIEGLAVREKNVDVICDNQGIEILLDVMKKHKRSNSVKQSVTRCLGRLAINSENATKIARGGGINSMVDTINESKEFDESTSDAIQLMDHLSLVDKNVEVVVREGGVEALTNQLTSASKQKEISDKLFVATKALATLTSNERAARMIGRDDEAIIKVLGSISEKPKFARLCGYGVNCLANLAQNKHNLETIVKAGGIDTVVATMAQHMGNNKMISESSRTMCALAKEPEYADECGKQGALPLALKFLSDNPENNGVPALAMCEDLCKGSPKNIGRLVECGGLKILLDVMNKNPENTEVLDRIMRLLNFLAQSDPDIAAQIAALGGPKIVLEGLKKHPELSILCRNAMSCLVAMADVDEATFEFIKAEGAVMAITAAMEMHPDDEELLKAGTDALQCFADPKDLQHAMDTVGRSRMEEQTAINMALTSAAIGVVGNLALIEANIDYIVSEGGIPVLLSVINGASADADHSEAAAKILESGIRALGRLLLNDGNAAEFQREGGIETLVSLLRAHADKERIMNACVTAVGQLITTKTGFDGAVNSEIIDAVIDVARQHPEYQIYDQKMEKTFLSMVHDDRAISKMVDAGVIETNATIMDANPNDAETVSPAVALLQALLNAHPELTEQIAGECAQQLLQVLLENPDKPELCAPIMKLLKDLAKSDPDVLNYLKDLGITDAINAILDANPLDKVIVAQGTALLTLLAGEHDLVNAISNALQAARALQRDPENVDMIEVLGTNVSLISNMSGDPRNQKVIVDNGGLEAYPIILNSLANAKPCLAQESTLEEASLGLNRLMKHLPKDAMKRAVAVGGPVQALEESFLKHPDYENVGVHQLGALQEVVKHPDLTDNLLSLPTVESLSAMIEKHPLNDAMIRGNVRLIAKLADTDIHGYEVIKKGGGLALMHAVKHLTGIDEPLIDALLAVGRLADQCGTASFALKEDGLGDLSRVLHVHKAQPEVMTAATNCLASLCQDPKFAQAFAQDGALDMVIEGLKRNKDDPVFCSGALSVLENICETPENVSELHNLDGQKAIHDVIQHHKNEEPVQAYGIRALALCAEASPPICSELGQNGSIRDVMNALRNFPNSAPVTMAVAQFIRALVKDEGNHNMLQNEGAADALRHAAEMFLDDPEVTDVIQSALNALEPGGRQMLTAIRGHIANDNPEMLMATLDALSHLLESTSDGIDFSSAEAVDVINAVLQAYKHEAIATSAFRTAAALALEDEQFANDFANGPALQNILDFMEDFPNDEALADRGVALLSSLAIHPRCMAALAGTNTIPQTLKAMQNFPDNQNIQLNGVRVLNNLARSNDPKVLRSLANCGAIPIVTQALQRFPHNAELVKEAGELLRAMGVDPNNSADLQEAIRAMEWASRVHPNDRDIQALSSELANSYKLMDIEEEDLPPPPPPTFGNLDNDSTDVAPSGGLKSAVHTLGDLRGDPDTIFNAVQALGARKMNDDEIDELVDLEAIQKLCMCLNKFRDDPLMVKNLANVFNHFTANPDNITEIVANGGIGALLKALRKHEDQPDTLASGIALLGNLATNDHLKTLIGLQGGIPIILRAMELYPDHQFLLDKCCYCLANLSFNNPPNMAAVVQGGGVPLIIGVMERHTPNVDLMDSGTCCLSNLCYNNMENKALICRTGGAAVITNMLNVHSGADDLIMTGFRALGNLAFNRDNIPLILEEGAAAAIVGTMKDNPENEELLQLALAVLGNLASDGQAKNLKAIIEEKSIEACIEASGLHQEAVALQLSAMGFLGNICNDARNATTVCKAGGVQMVLQTMRILDWEEQVVSVALQLLAGLSTDETNVSFIVEQRGPSDIIMIMKAHEGQAPITKLGLLALAKLVINHQTAEMVAKQGAIETAIDALIAYIHDDKMMIDALRVLMNLSIIDENSHLIASNAVMPTLKGMQGHKDNQIFLRIAASFMGNLAIYGAASKLLVEQGVCPEVLNVIRENLDYPGLLSKLVRALVNMLLTSNETARQACSADDGLKTVRGVLALHPNHQQLRKACEQFIKKMTEPPKQRRHIATQQILTLREQIPPKMRNRMTAGTVCRKFCKKSAPRKRHIKISDDFEALMWEDPTGKKPRHAVPIQGIKEIRPGACTHQLKRTMYNHKQAVPDRSFAIFYADQFKKPQNLNLEAKTVAEAQAWIEMLELLMKLHEPIGFKAM